jgi:hypothetical protein
VTTSGPPRNGEPTTGPVSPAQSLAAFLLTRTGVVVHSDPIPYGNAHVAFVGVEHGPHDRAIVVVSIAHGAASPVATLALPYPYFDFALDRPIQTGDVTGDGLPDALVRFVAADNLPGVAVSADGGAWRLLPQNADPASVFLGNDPAMVNGALRGTQNDCTPSCAQGHLSPVTWQYDRQQNRLLLTPA